MTTATAPLVIDEPGLYPDMPANVYLADPVPGGSLSSSGARRLLPPSCPALFKHWRDGATEYKPEFDFGHAAHREVLGAGAELVVIDADDWRTKAARAERDAAYAAGLTPILAHDYQVVLAMAAALRAHPVAAALFAPGSGAPEQTLVWRDQATGVQCRARLDWLPGPRAGRRLVVPDYKTCRSAAPDNLQREIHNFGYHQQAAWYLDGVTALGLDPAPLFVFVFQEKTAPYLVTVVRLDRVAMQVGRYLNRQARETYARCVREDRWPGYSDDIELIPLPAWVERTYSDEEIW